jgi:hypothetical protein
MKIFWSWQSDRDGRTNRHLIKDAIEEAIAALKVERDIEEAERDIELDHDRKGVPGSPDLAATILNKIRKSNIFIADVTPIGMTPNGKKIMNPNVAIELGTALETVGNHGLLMVFNQAYGDREDLPFDLRHKAGPIMFNLVEGASNDEIKTVCKELAGCFKNALREIMNSLPAPVQPKNLEQPTTFNRAVFFEKNEVLANRNNGVEWCFEHSQPFLYLRVIPVQTQIPIEKTKILQLSRAGLEPMKVYHGYGHERNRYGAIVFDQENGNMISASQIFYSREIWGLDQDLLKVWERPGLGKKKIIPAQSFEQLFINILKKYITFARGPLAIQGPLIIEGGAAGIEGYFMGMRAGIDELIPGPIHEPEISWRGTLDEFSDKKINTTLLGIFEKFYEECGYSRPLNWNNFPANIVADNRAA